MRSVIALSTGLRLALCLSLPIGIDFVPEFLRVVFSLSQRRPQVLAPRLPQDGG